jgi:monoamine oxidase
MADGDRNVQSTTARGLSRRAMLGVSGAGLAGGFFGLSPGRASAAPPTVGTALTAQDLGSGGASQECEVVVIGAGLAGLTAARDLAAAGVDVVVLEAQQRVGGRTLTVDLGGGAFIDHGGQWVSPGQDQIVALAADLGVALFPSWGDGQTVDWRNGVRSVYSGLFPPGDPTAEPEARQAAATLAAMATQIPLDAPWDAPEAQAWDAITLQQWLDPNVASAMARAALAQAFEGVFIEGPGRPSLLACLYWAASGDPLVPYVATTPLGPDRRFVGGAQQLCQKMAEALGDRVHLGAWVSLVEHDDDRVLVTAGEHRIGARAAVVAMAPMIAGRIRYAPALPANRDQLTQRAPMGWFVKVHAVYPSRFWTADGLSGGITSDAGAVKVTADNSPPSGTPGILVGFIQGAAARRLASATADERRAATLADLVTYFGPQAAHPLQYAEHNWGDDEFTRGAEGGYWQPGVWTAYGPALRPSIGPLHWAGTETSPVWYGKMEGAIRSGHRVAQEVLTTVSAGTP